MSQPSAFIRATWELKSVAPRLNDTMVALGMFIALSWSV